MNVLAVDTSGEGGSVALAREGCVLEAAALPLGWSTTTLHSEIARLLGHHRLATTDIQGYGVTTGPGSFSGVRVGLTAVKGLAEVHGVRIVPVSTLEVLAAAGQSTGRAPRQAAFVTLLDARRGQIFGAVYQEKDGCWKPLIEDCVGPLRPFLERARAAIGKAAVQDTAFCGMDLAPFIPEIEQAGWAGAPMVTIPPLLAGPLAQIAIRSLQQGLGVEAADVGANYVRVSDAELFWKA